MEDTKADEAVSREIKVHRKKKRNLRYGMLESQVLIMSNLILTFLKGEH